MNKILNFFVDFLVNHVDFFVFLLLFLSVILCILVITLPRPDQSLLALFLLLFCYGYVFVLLKAEVNKGLVYFLFVFCLFICYGLVVHFTALKLGSLNLYKDYPAIFLPCFFFSVYFLFIFIYSVSLNFLVVKIPFDSPLFPAFSSYIEKGVSYYFSTSHFWLPKQCFLHDCFVSASLESISLFYPLDLDNVFFLNLHNNYVFAHQLIGGLDLTTASIDFFVQLRNISDNLYLVTSDELSKGTVDTLAIPTKNPDFFRIFLPSWFNLDSYVFVKPSFLGEFIKDSRALSTVLVWPNDSDYSHPTKLFTFLYKSYGPNGLRLFAFLSTLIVIIVGLIPVIKFKSYTYPNE